MRADYDVTVCSSCLRASCWHGEFYCEMARNAGITTRKASELRRLKLEHSSHFTKRKIEQVTGNRPTDKRRAKEAKP